MPPKRSRKRRAIVLACLTTLLVVVAGGLATLVLGRVSGREFAPSHFRLRSYVFWEIPLVHLQVSPITRNTEAANLTNYLRSQNFLRVPAGPPTSWQQVEIRRGLTTPTPADPQILTEYLELGEPLGTPVWETWSRDHPKAAAVLWPVIQRLALQDLYVLVPEVFAIAERQTDPTKLGAEIDAYLRSAFVSLAKDLIAADRPALAASVIHDGLADDPQHVELRALLDQVPEPLRTPPAKQRAESR